MLFPVDSNFFYDFLNSHIGHDLIGNYTFHDFVPYLKNSRLVGLTYSYKDKKQFYIHEDLYKDYIQCEIDNGNIQKQEH